jgi:hypothetical protein
VWRLITDYREYRPLVSSVRVRRQRTGVSGLPVLPTLDLDPNPVLYVHLPSVPPIVYDDATKSDPVDGNDMDEDDYEGRTYRR